VQIEISIISLYHHLIYITPFPIFSWLKRSYIGCLVALKCFVACLLGEESQQPICHTSNINANVPNQNPSVDILHNHLVFLVLYFDLLAEDECSLSQTFIYTDNFLFDSWHDLFAKSSICSISESMGQNVSLTCQSTEL